LQNSAAISGFGKSSIKDAQINELFMKTFLFLSID